MAQAVFVDLRPIFYCSISRGVSVEIDISTFSGSRRTNQKSGRHYHSERSRIKYKQNILAADKKGSVPCIVVFALNTQIPKQEIVAHATRKPKPSTGEPGAIAKYCVSIS